MPGVFRRRNRSDAPIGAVCDLAATDDPRDRSINSTTTKSLSLRVNVGSGETQAGSAHAAAEAGSYNPHMAILGAFGAFGLLVLLSAAAGTLLYFVLVTLSGLFHEGVADVRELSKSTDRSTRRRLAFEAFVVVSALIPLFVVSSWTGSPTLGMAAGMAVPLLRATIRDVAESLHSGQVRVRNWCVRRCGRLNSTESVCR